MESVFCQTVSNWELIVVDDGSDVPAMPSDHPQVRLLRLPECRGPGAARNAGVAASRGTFLAFLDDDDVFTAERLEIALEGLQRAPIATYSLASGIPHD